MSTPLPPTFEWPLMNSVIEQLPTGEGVEPTAKGHNTALQIVICARLTDMAQKTCYVCDGWGHTADGCPTAKLVTRIVTQQDFPEIKQVLVAAVAAQKGKQFRNLVSHRQEVLILPPQ